MFINNNLNTSAVKPMVQLQNKNIRFTSQIKKDVFQRSKGMDTEEFNELVDNFKGYDSEKIFNDILQKTYWTNGMETIGINYNEDGKAISGTIVDAPFYCPEQRMHKTSLKEMYKFLNDISKGANFRKEFDDAKLLKMCTEKPTKE